MSVTILDHITNSLYVRLGTALAETTELQKCHTAYPEDKITYLAKLIYLVEYKSTWGVLTEPEN